MKRVLLIDDEQGVHDSLARTFAMPDTPKDWEWMGEFTMHDGVNRIMEWQPDVVLLDLALPDSDRENSLLAIPRIAAQCAVIPFTGTDDNENWCRAIELGATNFFQKKIYLLPTSRQFFFHGLTNAYFKYHAPKSDEQKRESGRSMGVFVESANSAVGFLNSGAALIITVVTGIVGVTAFYLTVNSRLSIIEKRLDAHDELFKERDLRIRSVEDLMPAIVANTKWISENGYHVFLMWDQRMQRKTNHEVNPQDNNNP